ncbi:MAG: hypothetical protein MUF55_11685, partial [Hydrogenophaga sp.]|nr:hypothetical protein [Hydrogenophaga sp.]
MKACRFGGHALHGPLHQGFKPFGCRSGAGGQALLQRLPNRLGKFGVGQGRFAMERGLTGQQLLVQLL